MTHKGWCVVKNQTNKQTNKNSFLVYHFKSLNLVQISAMNETFITIAGH